MMSPFPGMDPYLEDPGIWEDFHLTLIVALRGQLNRTLPPGYTASADRHVWIEDPESDERQWRDPDVFVSREKGKKRRVRGNGRTAVAAPQVITVPVGDRKGTPYLKVIDDQERRVVTVFELLSPTNKKSGPQRNAYLEKREEYLTSGVNLV